MKPRSAVGALLALTETLLAARAKAAQAKQGSAGQALRSARVEEVVDSRPPILRIKAQAIS